MGRWLAATAGAVTLAAATTGCGGASVAHTDPNDAAAVVRAWVESNLKCQNPDMQYVMACKPVENVKVEAHVARRVGDYALVDTTIDGKRSGGVWVVRRLRGYVISPHPPPGFRP